MFKTFDILHFGQCDFVCDLSFVIWNLLMTG